jgi:hypothetical protein
MDELIKSSRTETSKSNYLLELRQHPSGEQYVKIEHTIKALKSKSEILISATTLTEILETLYNFNQEIKFKEKTDWIKVRDQLDEKLIVSFFLKGVTIKDLSLAYRYDEKTIIDILTKNEIVIIDGIDISNKNSYIKRKKKR